MSTEDPVRRGRLPGSWRLYADVLEVVANAVLASAVWGGVTVLLAAFVARETGTWVFLLAPVVGLLGAGLSIRRRAVHVWERTRGVPTDD